MAAATGHVARPWARAAALQIYLAEDGLPRQPAHQWGWAGEGLVRLRMKLLDAQLALRLAQAPPPASPRPRP